MPTLISMTTPQSWRIVIPSPETPPEFSSTAGAVSRPTMRFIPIKTAECQAALMVLKSRDLLVRQRTQAINAVRGHLAELGIVVAKGLAKVGTLIAIVRDENDQRLPPAARMALKLLAEQIEVLTERTLLTKGGTFMRKNPAATRAAA